MTEWPCLFSKWLLKEQNPSKNKECNFPSIFSQFIPPPISLLSTPSINSLFSWWQRHFHPLAAKIGTTNRLWVCCVAVCLAVYFQQGFSNVPSWESDSFNYSCYLSISCFLISRYCGTHNWIHWANLFLPFRYIWYRPACMYFLTIVCGTVDWPH